MNGNIAYAGIATVVAISLSSPAAAMNCFSPPGYPKGTAEWESKGRTTEEYLITSDGQKYSCGTRVNTIKSLGRIGDRDYYKQACGPLTIITENSHRECTLSERAGTSGGYSRLGSFMGALNQYICAKSGSIVDSRRRLRDRSGAEFELAKYGDSDGKFDLEESCTSQMKIKVTSREFDVGKTSTFIKLVEVQEFRVKRIAQPSL